MVCLNSWSSGGGESLALSLDVTLSLRKAVRIRNSVGLLVPRAIVSRGRMLWIEDEMLP